MMLSLLLRERRERPNGLGGNYTDSAGKSRWRNGDCVRCAGQQTKSD